MGAALVRVMTERQKALVEGLLADLPIKQAAEIAGYADVTSAYTALRSDLVQDALATARDTRIKVTLSAKALKAMEALLDDGTPPATRFAAAKWTLDYGKAAQDEARDKPLHEMSETELGQFMARAQRAIDEGGDAPLIVVVPGDGALPTDPEG